MVLMIVNSEYSLLREPLELVVFERKDSSGIGSSSGGASGSSSSSSSLPWDVHDLLSPSGDLKTGKVRVSEVGGLMKRRLFENLVLDEGETERFNGKYKELEVVERGEREIF